MTLRWRPWTTRSSRRILGSKSSGAITISAIDPTAITRFAQCCTFCAAASRQNKLFICERNSRLWCDGIYYEGWRFAGKPTNEPQPDEFAKCVEAQLPPQFSRDALSVMKAVLDLLGKELDPGETMKVIRALPARCAPCGPTPPVAQPHNSSRRTTRRRCR